MTLINRAEEITILYDEVMARKSLFFHGPSGTGKTFLCHELMEKLRGRRVCFYLSIRAYSSLHQFLSKLQLAVKSTTRIHTNVEFQLRAFFDDNPVPETVDEKAFKQWTENLLVALQQVSQDFIFILEDVDQYEGKEDLSKLFKHFFLSRNSQILFTSRLFNQAYGVEGMKLKSLLPKQVTTPLADEDELSELIEFTRGNTAFILDIIQQMERAKCSFSTAANLVMESQQKVLYAFRHRFTDLQWNLIRAIAAEEVVEQPHSFKFLVKYQLGAASSIERALSNLTSTSVVHKNEFGYTVSNIVFLRWVQWLYNS
ncbi:ATP-binding protein [Owenweeksia hongkongensis]|nr:ATP-binding protein [Owenweeksia hongkongensis]